MGSGSVMKVGSAGRAGTVVVVWRHAWWRRLGYGVLKELCTKQGRERPVGLLSCWAGLAWRHPRVARASLTPLEMQFAVGGPLLLSRGRRGAILVEKAEAGLKVLPRSRGNEPGWPISRRPRHGSGRCTHLSPVIRWRLRCGLALGVPSLCCLLISRRRALSTASGSKSFLVMPLPRREVREPALSTFCRASR